MEINLFLKLFCIIKDMRAILDNNMNFVQLHKVR